MEKDLKTIAKKHLKAAARHLQLVGDLLDTNEPEAAIGIIEGGRIQFDAAVGIIRDALSQTELTLKPVSGEKIEIQNTRGK